MLPHFCAPRAARILIVLSAAVAAGALAGGSAPVLAAVSTATITVNAAAPGRRENPHMWGIFLEDVNQCIDGGLDPQMINNWDFKNDVPPADVKVIGGRWKLPNGGVINPPPGGPMLAWKAIAHGGTRPALSIVHTKPLSVAHQLSLRIATSAGGQGVANLGYYGMRIRAGRRYRLSLYLRTRVPQTLTATLQKHSGRNLGAARVHVSGIRWKKYQLTITAAGTTPRGRLRLTFRRAGVAHLTLVRMVPLHRHSKKPVLYRPDILRLLAALKTSFIRFPGGNFVEGVSVDDSFHLLQTMGPMIDRPGHYNCWNYHDNDDLGFLEYLNLCRVLHAQPMYGTFAGMPLGPPPYATRAALHPFIKQMLTACAIAGAPDHSRWGKLRAKYGFPQADPLRYLEIGNENGGPAYQANFQAMRKALARRYPKITPITCVWGGHPNQHVKILDEHYYRTADYFMWHANRYDHYSRQGPHIFVGEYAAFWGRHPRADIRGALGEAAYMVGMERNCDVVTLASYGTLLSRMPKPGWPMVLIFFNNAEAFGRTCYWVQYLFSHNRPTTVYPAQVRARLQPMVRGRVALSTQNCAAAFRGISVRGPKLPPSYNSLPWKWQSTRGAHAGLLMPRKVYGPNWRFSHGTIIQGDPHAGALISFGRHRWRNYTLKLQVKKLSGVGAPMIVFRRDEHGDQVELHLGGSHDKRFFISVMNNHHRTIVTGVHGALRAGRWNTVKVALHGQQVQCFLNGKKLLSGRAAVHLPRFFADAGYDDHSGTVILKIVNNSRHRVAAHIRFRGLAGIARSGKLIVLAGRHRHSENSFSRPNKLTPKTSVLRGIQQNFTCTVPRYSMSVIRVKAQRANKAHSGA